MEGIKCSLVVLFGLFIMGIKSASIGGAKTQRDVESTQTAHGRCHWYSPCESAIQQAGLHSPPSPQTLSQAYRDMAVKAFGVSRLSRDLLASYIKNATHDPEYMSLFDRVHFSEFPLTRFTDNQLEIATGQTNTFLVQAYQEMAAISVYMNKVRLENKEWSAGGSSMFYSTIDGLSIQQCDLMCSLNIHIKATKGLGIPETVTDDVLDARYEALGGQEMLRYVRDYIIIRDYHHYLNYLGKVMQALEKNH